MYFFCADSSITLFKEISLLLMINKISLVQENFLFIESFKIYESVKYMTYTPYYYMFEEYIINYKNKFICITHIFA